MRGEWRRRRKKKKEPRWRHTSSVFSGLPPVLLANSSFSFFLLALLRWLPSRSFSPAFLWSPLAFGAFCPAPLVLFPLFLFCSPFFGPCGARPLPLPILLLVGPRHRIAEGGKGKKKEEEQRTGGRKMRNWARRESGDWDFSLKWKNIL